METINLFHSLHKISKLKGEWVHYIINESLIVSLEDSLFLLCHYLNHLSKIFHLLEAHFDSHCPVHCQIAESSTCSVLIKFVTYFSINSEAEIIHKMFGKNLSFNAFILSILDSLKFPIRTYTNLSLPNIQSLYFCFTPLFNEILKLPKPILSEFRLLLAPSQIPREIIASPKRNNSQID